MWPRRYPHHRWVFPHLHFIDNFALSLWQLQPQAGLKNYTAIDEIWRCRFSDYCAPDYYHHLISSLLHLALIDMGGKQPFWEIQRAARGLRQEGKRYAESGPQAPQFSSSSSLWRGCGALLLDKNKDCGGTEAREAFLWKSIQSYVEQDQTSHPGVKNPSAAAFMVDLKHPQAQRKKPLSVFESPSGIQDSSPPEIFLDEIRNSTAEPRPS